MIKCYNKNCIHQRGDYVCNLEEIEIDRFGNCMNCKPANTCGKCVKFGTDKCEFYGTFTLGLMDETDAICSEENFQPMILFVNNEKGETDENN